ncbi:uncharacterized protein LOC115626002 isoform X2 [Scaptodrosophila lebanonensis]|uniref:Uncharacterized protein LOC115626002 isoform X2 n=1 Tax=Drosophila lebanonensis TaxID=7225 RepID=A0A6J2TPS1_DROLE|nr:uncharacterized protein LOC115626002 isoform X2 [Scaptodrosophila lebanonensis]
MNNQNTYLDDFAARWRGNHPDDKYLPPFVGGPVDEIYQQELIRRDIRESQQARQDWDNEQQTLGMVGDSLPPTSHAGRAFGKSITPLQQMESQFWVAIGEYPYERAYAVYQFFSDIGQCSDRYFKRPNVIYLKYCKALHSETALSYNAQKVGYGADIPVKVWKETPSPEILEVKRTISNSQNMGSQQSFSFRQ